MKLSLFACLCLSALASPAYAQQNAPPPVNGIADLVGVSAEMERLSPMEGTWKVDAELYRPKLQRWGKGESFTAFFSKRYGGHYIETELVPLTGTQGYVVHIAFSYDKFRKEYRAFFRENIFGLLDIFEGNFEGDTLLVSNKDTGTSGPSMAGNIEPNQLAIKLEGNNRFTLTLSGWRNGQWVNGMRYTFNRVTPAGQ